MCGRYASSRSPQQLVEEFEVESVQAPVLAPDYNIAPSKSVYAVLERPEKDDRPRHRQLRSLTWGLIPPWAKDPTIGNRLINARVETVAEKPSFSRAFAARRTILPADGYYEWYATKVKNAAGRQVKQPFFIRPKDKSILAMAGLYEIWRDQSLPEDDPGGFRWTCTILTTSAEDALGQIHPRMPLMLTPAQYDEWLDPTLKDPQRLQALLTPAAPGRLEAYPVSTLVSNVRNNGAQLIDSVSLD